MKRAVLIVAAVLALAGCASHTATRAEPQGHTRGQFAGTPIPRGSTAADFALRDQDGHLVRLSALHGRLVFIAFLYTHCTDVCPLIATWLDHAAHSLGPKGRGTRVLAVSVDPGGDTRAAVHEFISARHLGPELHWLIGTRAQLAPVWQAYNVLVEARSPEQVAHAAPIFLLDRRGRPRVFYSEPKSGAAFVHDARLFLRSNQM